jgi:methylmalonyl-CoA mutase
MRSRQASCPALHHPFEIQKSLLQEETDTDMVIDAWGGSYYVERLTHELMLKAWAHIVECEKYGGMAKAIENGFPKRRIEEASAMTQALIDSRAQVIVGLNKYTVDKQEEMKVLKIDKTAVREGQTKRLRQLKAERDAAKVAAALNALTECPRTSQGNLLDLSIQAARAKATVGELRLGKGVWSTQGRTGTGIGRVPQDLWRKETADSGGRAASGQIRKAHRPQAADLHLQARAGRA